jgi:hypothetical protein
MNIDEARITRHVRERLIERINQLDRDEMTIAYLWRCGRPARSSDFTNFAKHALPGQQYRVCKHKGREYMLVYDTNNKTFVTLWQK